MVAIDDSDALLQQDPGARLVTDLLQRGQHPAQRVAGGQPDHGASQLQASGPVKQSSGGLVEAGVYLTEWEHPINDPECWEMFDPLRVRFYELRRHADVWAVVAVISQIGGTAMSEPADMISWADQAIELRFSTPRSSWQRGPTTDCPGVLTLYSDIKGELTAKNTDAGIFDAILRIY